MKHILTLACAVLPLMAFPALSQDHDGHAHHHTTTHAEEKPHDYYATVMEEMHEGMMLEPTGNVDADFMRGMIPHHQGAVAMAEIVLEHGEDAEVRALAEQVIATQNAEIEQMRTWLTENGYATDQE